MHNLKVVQGDLFDQDRFRFDVIGHGVNCKGVMGAGIAKVFRDKYPDMYEHYRVMCKYGILKPGDCYSYVSASRPDVFNLASQNDPGADAKPEWLAQSLYNAIDGSGLWVRNLGLPWIGAGIGGLDKVQVLEVVQDIARIFPGVNFTIVEL